MSGSFTFHIHYIALASSFRLIRIILPYQYSHSSISHFISSYHTVFRLFAPLRYNYTAFFPFSLAFLLFFAFTAFYESISWNSRCSEPFHVRRDIRFLSDVTPISSSRYFSSSRGRRLHRAVISFSNILPPFITLRYYIVTSSLLFTF